MAWLLPLTGVSADVSRAYRAGAEIAAAEINRGGGVMGRPVELVFRDDKLSANDTLAAFEELSGNGINLFLGSIYPAGSLAIVPRLAAANAVLISTGSISLNMTHESFDPHFFRCLHNSYASPRAQAYASAKRFPDVLTWSGIAPDLQYGHDAWDAFVSGLKEFYGKFVGKEPRIIDPAFVKFGAGDFKNQISAMLDQKIEGFLNFLAGSDSYTFYQQSRTFGLDKQLRVFHDNGKDLTVGTVLKRNIPHNLWSSTFWYFGANATNPMSRALYDSYVEQTKDPYPGGLVGAGHTAMQVMAQAISAARSTDAPALIDALETTEYSTVNGKMRFRREDHQILGDIGVIGMGPKEAEPGWGVIDFLSVPATEVVEPPSPGRTFKI
jgi:branched-chain amino acid transport system substrate-binding protein